MGPISNMSADLIVTSVFRFVVAGAPLWTRTPDGLVRREPITGGR